MPLRRFDGHLQSRSEINRAAAGRGLLSAESRDRVIRRVPLVARIGQVVVHLNGENLTNVRQTHYDPLLLPTPREGGRWTTDEWAPLEGRLLNLGVRIGF